MSFKLNITRKNEEYTTNQESYKKSQPKIAKNISASILNLKEGGEVYKGETHKDIATFKK
jgi:hypothetical protein